MKSELTPYYQKLASNLIRNCKIIITYVNGASLKTIATEYNISSQQVKEILRKYGIIIWMYIKNTHNIRIGISAPVSLSDAIYDNWNTDTLFYNRVLNEVFLSKMQEFEKSSIKKKSKQDINWLFRNKPV